jgi:uncharacterized protein with PIN domain
LLNLRLSLTPAVTPIATRRFDDFMKEASISIEPVTAEQAQIARAAYIETLEKAADIRRD